MLGGLAVREKRVVFGAWTVKARGRGRLRKPCDGSANDYMRHRRASEEPCAKSRKAWNKAQRRAKRVGFWDGSLTYKPDRDENNNKGDFGRGVIYERPDRYVDDPEDLM